MPVRWLSRLGVGLGLVLVLAACAKGPQLPLLASDATILAFGDSLTAGTGAGEAESYPAHLAQLSGRRVVNAGIPGEVSAAGLQRLPELLERERPALLILCHGGNDLLARQDHQSIAANLRAMIRLAQNQGVAVVLLAVPAPDFSLKPPALYADVAKECAVPLEGRALAKILGKSSLKSDHIHPNAAGYRLLAAAVVKLLHQRGALPR
jgi:lysophospholipase L1-like esterase